MNSGIIALQELRIALRSRRTLAALLIIVACLCLVLLSHWPRGGHADLAGRQSRRVFEVFAYTLCAAMAVLAPLFAATAVVRERQRGTLSLLLASPLRPADIVFGKYAGVLSFLWLMLALSLPVAAACQSMGGIALFDQVGALYVALIAMSIQLSAIGIWISARAQRIEGAIRIGFAWVLGILFFPLILNRFIRPIAPPTLATLLDWVHEVSPLKALLHIVNRAGAGVADATSITQSTSISHYALAALVTAAIFLALSWRLLSKPTLDRPMPAGTMTDDRSARTRFFRRIMYLWFFDPQRRSRLIGNFTNPVLIKELRSSKLGRSHWLMRILGLMLLVSLGLTIAAARLTMVWGVSTLGGGVVLLQMAVILVLTPALASPLIAGERETQSWRLLALTPLSVPRLLFGKLAAVLLLQILVLSATMPSYLVLVLIDAQTRNGIVTSALTLLGATLYSLLLSAAVGSFFSRAAAATVAGFLAVLLPVAVTLFMWSGVGTAFDHSTVQKALVVNTIAATFSSLRLVGFEDYAIVSANGCYMAIVSVLSFLVLCLQTWQLRRPK